MGFLAQIILAARSIDGGWGQLLVFVVIGIFWIVSFIAKAKENKIKLVDEEGEEEELAKPVDPRRPQPQRRIQQQRPVSRPERQGADAARSGKHMSSQKRRALSTASVERSVKLADKTVAGVGADVVSPEIGYEIAASPVVDFADPEELRRAILHYEILGKPLSMRE